MFIHRYFPERYFADRYFPDAVIVSALSTPTGYCQALFAASTHTPSMIGVTSGGTSAVFVSQNYTAGVAVGGVQDT